MSTTLVPNRIIGGLTRVLTEADRIRICSSPLINSVARRSAISLDGPVDVLRDNALAVFNAAPHMVVSIRSSDGDRNAELHGRLLQTNRQAIIRFLASRGFVPDIVASPLVEREVLALREEERFPSALVMRFRRTRVITANDLRAIQEHFRFLRCAIPDTGR